MQINKVASSTVKKIYNNVRQHYSAKLSKSKNILYNKYVLYVSFIICFMNVIMWMINGNFLPVAIFMLAGYLTTFFSKNMIVILVISFVVSNVVNTGKYIALEGMENKEEKKKASSENNKKKDGFKSQEDTNEEHEGVDGDETYEGVDEEPCTADTDCKNGQICDTSKFVCVAK